MLIFKKNSKYSGPWTTSQCKRAIIPECVVETKNLDKIPWKYEKLFDI